MKDNKFLAEALLDIAKNSETTFVEVAEDKELIETAKKLGIILPSPDLAVLKTVYAEIDKVNKNGIILPKEAVKKGLPTLIGKQINWEHNGAGRICGYIIDAQINKDLIEITCVVFKSLFPEEMIKVKEKFEKKELCVSFEIWNRNPEDKESVVHELENGIRSIDPIIFHGCGLLLVNPPACPKAKVYKLVAKVLTETENIIDKVFGEDLIFASLAIEESKCKNCGTCTCEEEEKKVEEVKIENIVLLVSDYEPDCEIEESKILNTEQRNALPDNDFALIQEKEGKKIRRFPINDEAHVRNALARLPQAKDITEEEKKLALEKILKKAKELNMDELVKKYEKSQERLCPECNQPLNDEETEVCAKCLKKKEKSSEETQAEAKPEETKTDEKSEVIETKSEEIKAEETKEEIVIEKKEEEAQLEQESEPKKIISIVTEETIITTETPDGTINKKGLRRVTRKFDDNTEEVFSEDYQVTNTYSQSQLEEKVNTSTDETIAAMPKEVSDRIKELIKDGKSVKEAMKQAWDEYKKSQEKALEEKDIEITKVKEELGKKDQEIVELKNPIVEEKVEKILTVGSVTVKDNYKTVQSEVNKKAFGKR